MNQSSGAVFCHRRVAPIFYQDVSWGRTFIIIFGPPDAKSRLIGKDPDARKDQGQGEKGATEDEMVGWYH